MGSSLANGMDLDAEDVAKALHDGADLAAKDVAGALREGLGLDADDVARALRSFLDVEIIAEVLLSDLEPGDVAKALDGIDFGTEDIAGALLEANLDAEDVAKALSESLSLDALDIYDAFTSLGLLDYEINDALGGRDRCNEVTYEVVDRLVQSER